MGATLSPEERAEIKSRTYEQWVAQAQAAYASESQVAERELAMSEAEWVLGWKAEKFNKQQWWLSEGSAYWNAQAAELAKELLLFKMEAFSEDYYAAGWLTDLEHILWQQGEPWRHLAAIAGGMWTWGLGSSNRWFMPLEDFLELHADWLERR